MDFVWVFNGNGASCPSAVFSTREVAESWIKTNSLSGMLTKYPLDVPVFDFAIQNGWFTATRGYHTSPAFIQRFTSAYQEHYHYDSKESQMDAENTP